MIDSASTTSYSSLRKKANRIAADKKSALSEEEQLDLLRLVHELEVAQVDLEARNEQLRLNSRELEASQLELWALYESAPVAYVTLSKKGIIQRANAAARQLLSANSGDLIGLEFSRFVRPEDMGLYFQHLRSIASVETPSSLEMQCMDTTRKPIDVHCLTSPKFDPEGRFNSWQMAFFDVSGQKRLENSLRTSREYLALAARSGKIGIWAGDLQTGQFFWNEQLYLLLGLTPRKGPESREAFFKSLHPADYPSVLAGNQKLMQRGDRFQRDFRIIRADDGAVRWLASRGEIKRDPAGRPIRIQGVNYDITERKQAEQILSEYRLQLEMEVENRTAEIQAQSRELEELNAIVKQMSRKTIRAMENDRRTLSKDIHDGIAGTLAAIKMQLEAHLRAPEEVPAADLMPLEKIVAYLNEAIQETRNISYLLRSRTLDDFGLKAALSELLRLFKQFYPDIDVEAHIDVPDEGISEDVQTVLYRVVQEALNNIVRHSEAIRVSLELSGRPDHIGLEITDNGRGFELEKTLSLPNGTPGFGVHSMRERVELCKGKFQIHSRPGRGTTIEVSIPLS